MYGASVERLPPLQQGVVRFNQWLPRAMSMVKREPYPVLGPEPLKLSSSPFYNDRRRINVVAIIVTLIVPWIIFATVFGCASFFWRFSSPGICCFIIAFCGLIVTFFGMTSYHQYRKRAVFNEPVRESSWFGPLFALSLLGWVLGLVIGSSNYSANMRPYYSFKSFQAYPDVHPGMTSGTAVLDGGIFIFTPTAGPDVSKAIAFRNVDTYCIAPVVADAKSLASYDFWAVGKNCCPGTGTGEVDFKCAEAQSFGTDGMGGLRVISDDASLQYYTLALQQAKERFKITVGTPIFMEWVRDPAGKVGQMEDRGLKRYLFWLLLVFGIQVFMISSMTVIISKTLF